MSSHAEICPTCKGTGKITIDTGTSAGKQEETCHGCGGSGWITVGVDYPDYTPTPYIPYIPPYTPWHPIPNYTPWTPTYIYTSTHGPITAPYHSHGKLKG